MHIHPSRFPSTIRAPTPLGGPPKKIRAALSAESRARSTVGAVSRPASVIGTMPGTPKKMGTQSRHGTPRRNESSCDMSSIVGVGADPEAGLVDFQNVEVDPDASFDGEDILTAGERSNLGIGSGEREDKVLVSIR